MAKPRSTLRPISWIKAARKNFEAFPQRAIDKGLDALTVVADGGMPDIAKPLTGLGAGVWELAIKERGDAYRSSTRCNWATTSGWFMRSRRSRSKELRPRATKSTSCASGSGG